MTMTRGKKYKITFNIFQVVLNVHTNTRVQIVSDKVLNN